MRFLIFILMFMPLMASANIPSTAYVQQQIASQIATAIANKADIQTVAAIADELGNKANVREVDEIRTQIGGLPTGYNTIGGALKAMVDTSASANQTMAGTYTVSGTMNFTGATTVPTAPLPSAE